MRTNLTDYKLELEWREIQIELREIEARHKARLRRAKRLAWKRRIGRLVRACFVLSLSIAFGWVLLLVSRAIFHLP